MLRHKVKILYIHFVRKPLFILWVRLIGKKAERKFIPNYFLSSLNYHDQLFKEILIEIETKEKILEEAELIIKNKFQTLGSDLTFLGEKIYWQKDFKSGRIWSKDFYTRIKSSQSRNGSDIKVPWELSRFHQAVWLGEAYLTADDEKYSKKYFDLISDWIEENPFCYGVNWNCAMEVAIRAVNWILSLEIFRTSSYFDKNLESKILNSLYEHGLFIRNNLEYGRRNGNHYLSDLMGLIWLGAVFSNYSFGKRWLNFARRELEKEIESQIYNDGVDYEKSTFYQRLVLEIIYNAQIALSLNGQSLSQASLQKMEKMFDFISSYIVDDTIPNVGDNDNGRVTQFSFSEKVDDLRYLISIRNLLFNNSQDEVLKENLSSDALFLFGVKGVNFLKSEIAKTKDSHNKTQLNSKSFLEGGFFILRNNDWFIFIDAGDIGMNGWGGHGHNDVFSFELFYKKRKFICDSGTYCYTSNPELRQQFRSTYSHNTIVVDKTEQAEFLNLFRIKDDFTQPRILEWKSNPNSDLLIVEHYGYTRLKHPVIHRRKFEFNKADDVVVISDYIDGRNKHEIEYNLHFAPDVSIESISETGFLLSINQIKLLLEFSSDADLKIKIVESKYSKSYGLLEENKKIYFSIFSKLPITITTSIKPKL